MYDRHTDGSCTDYEQSRPAPSAVISLALALLVPLAAVVAAAAPRTAVLLAVVPLLAVRYRRRD